MAGVTPPAGVSQPEMQPSIMAEPVSPVVMKGAGRAGRVGARPILCAFVILLALATLARAAPRPAFPGPRAGLVAVSWPTSQALDAFGGIWYYTYSFEGPVDARHHRVMMVLPHDDEARLAEAMRRNPGRWWIVGNEPNDPYQDNLSPQAYAAFYRRFERLAQRLDPTARLMTAGIANADWQWAQAFRVAYRQAYGRYPRVDAWNVHNYILEPDRSQLDQEAFRARLIAFRAWMDRVGEGDKPLVLSEFGVLMGLERHDTRYEPPEAIAAHIGETVAWLYGTDYVQAWAWFANDTSGLFNGDLYAGEQLTPYGEAYRDAIRAATQAEGAVRDGP